MRLRGAESNPEGPATVAAARDSQDIWGQRRIFLGGFHLTLEDVIQSRGWAAASPLSPTGQLR